MFISLTLFVCIKMVSSCTLHIYEDKCFIQDVLFICWFPREGEVIFFVVGKKTH